MKKFVRKPMVVEADVYLNDAMPPAGVCFCQNVGAHVHTKEGMADIEGGDYVVKLPNGEFIPCKQELFNTLYDRI